MLLKYIYPGILWAAFIAVLSGVPGNTLPDVKWDFLSFDKVAHAFVYLILTYLLCIGFYKQNRLRFLRYNGKTFAFGFSVLYGFLLEVAQFAFFIRRFFEWDDVIANTAGSILGLIVFNLVYGDSIKNL